MSSKEYLRALGQLYDLWSCFGVKGPDMLNATPEWRMGRFLLIESYLDKLCSDWKDMKYVQVTGTCGKGTTATEIAASLSRAVNCGLLTSPHVFHPRERVRTNKGHITEEEWLDIWDKEIMPVVEERFELEGKKAVPTFQESLLYLALIHFDHRGCEYAVLEAGRGGTYDPTNMVDPVTSVITNVHLDHTEVMGPTVEQIAKEKAGVIKQGIDFFTAASQPEVLNIFEKTCRKKGANFNRCSFDELPGKTVEACGIKPGSGETDIFLPARFEFFGNGIIADIAHNPAAMHHLAEKIRGLNLGPAIFVFGASDSKDVQGMLEPIAPLVHRLIITRAGFRYTLPEDIKKTALDRGVAEQNTEIIVNPKKALQRAKEVRGEGGMPIIVTGSCFVVDQALNPDRELAELDAKPAKRTKGN